MYRYEQSGELHGLTRVRGFTQDDAHIFCRPDQLEEEIFNILDLNLKILETFGFDQYDIYLSTRPDKYVGSDDHWQKSTDALKFAVVLQVALQVVRRSSKATSGAMQQKTPLKEVSD